MLGVGLIGAGTMGKIHACCYAAIPEAKLVAIFDQRKETARELAETFSCSTAEEVEAILNDPNINLIDICVPTTFHKKYAILAAGARKHIFCEKPLAHTLEEGQEILQAVSREGVKLMIGHVLRYFPEYLLAKELLDSGAIGRPAIVRTSRGGKFPEGTEDWYANFRISGGVILDLIIHDFDFLNWCFGRVERVFAQGLVKKNIPHLDYALVLLRFQSGVIAHVEGTWAMPEGFYTRLEIAGSEGLIDYDSREKVPLKVHHFPEAGAEKITTLQSPLTEDPYYLEIRDFVKCILDRREPPIKGEDALAALEVSLAALESLRTERVVNLPLTPSWQ